MISHDPNNIHKLKSRYLNEDTIEDSNNFEALNYTIKKRDLLNKNKLIKLLEIISPKILQFYEIVECIGLGSESVIYKSIHKKTNRTIAMKFIIKEKDEKININEYNILKKLKNFNIITYFGLYEIKKNELDCIIMEYAKFGNIRDFQKNILKRKDLSEQLLCYFTFQILNGLKYCHICKITHFDLKPQNIIIDDYLTAKIIDFSVSLDYSKINSNKIKLPFRGTSFYMAPEVLSSKIVKVKDLNKVDLFSLGVTLYALAFGKYPFGFTPDDDYEKIYKKIMKGIEIEDTKYYSKYFIDFLTKLLEKDINKRININEALNHYWIKGAQLLNNEKEKTDDLDIFLSYLIGDNIKSFRDYLYALN